MAFFFGGLVYPDVMVCGVRDGVSKKGVNYCTLTVVDKDGNTNDLSTSDPEQIQACHALMQGDRVDLRVVCAGGPKRQYAMIARGADSINPHGTVAGY